MDQIKTGAFLKELRKEKNLTQEQLAEILGTTDRSVSRWENGKNMPDISLLVELAELYEVDIREIIDGGRRKADMNAELKDNLLKVAEYEEERKNDLLKGLRLLNHVGVIGIVVFLILNITELGAENGIVRFISGVSVGLGLAALILQLLYMSGHLEHWNEKRKQKERL